MSGASMPTSSAHSDGGIQTSQAFIFMNTWGARIMPPGMPGRPT